MRIAVNTRFLLSSRMEGFGWYTFEVTKRLVEQHPEHEFIFFFDRPYDQRFVFGPNVTPVVLNPPARHPILFYIWFEWSVRRALKKYRCDVFFSPDGYLSLGSTVPQVGVIHDLNFEHYPQDIPWQPRLYLRRFFPKFARKAARIVTVSAYSKNDICTTYNIPEEKVIVGWNGASDVFQPLDPEQILSVRHTYTNGKPYFVFVGSLHPRKNVGRLLQAFTAFCQQHDAIDLLVVGENLWKNKTLQLPDMEESVRSRIHFTGHVKQETLVQLVGAAYCLAYVPYFEGFGIPLVEAMKCGIPIVSGNKTSLPEVAGNAALYCDPFDPESITQALLKIATDEKTYQELRKNAIQRAPIFSWNHTTEACWKAITSVIQ